MTTQEILQGVHDWTNGKIVYDISVAHPDGQGNPTKYATLAAALGTNGANIPQNLRKGGMSVKYVRSSDNNYIQFRCKAESFSTDPEDWAICGDEVLVDNPEFIKAECDSFGHLLFWIRKDGSIDWVIGVPTPVKAYVDALVSEILNGNEGTDIDGLNKVIAFLDDFSTSEKLAVLLNNKVDKEEGKGLIDEDVAERVHYTTSPEFLEVEMDNENHIIESTKRDGTKCIEGDLQVNGNLILKEVPSLIKDEIEDDIEENNEYVSNSPSYRNNYQRNILSNACRINHMANNAKDMQILVIADSHGANTAVSNAVEIANNFPTIDCILHIGDIEEETYNVEYMQSFYNIMKKSTKPWLITVGNHDVGNTMRVYYGATHQDVYNTFVKPMIDNGILRQSEIVQNKNYYYHDFRDYNVRVINIYEYDCPLDVADNEYWEEVEYNASYDSMELGVTYTYDSSNPIILNCGTYTGGSFRLKKTVTTTEGQYADDDTIPKYKCGRADRVIMQEQAEWLINTLKGTPDDYKIIIATHNPAMINSINQTEKKFAVNTAFRGSQLGQYSMQTDLLSEIVNAFINKEAKELKVIMSNSGWHGSGAAYLNTLNDGTTDYCYALDIDFSDRTNDNTKFICYIGGHSHMDLVFKHNTYDDQYSVNPICATNNYWMVRYSDVARPYYNDISYDALTTVSIRDNGFALARIGNDYTINGNKRDFEVINI